MSDQASQGLLSPYLQRARLNAAKPYLRGAILDIGSGNGSLARLVPPDRYLGVDADAESIAVAKANFPHHNFRSELPKTGAFDTVAALAVIEHVPTPASSLREWSSFLAPGGLLVLTTPHCAFRTLHDMGGRVGLFSRDAAEEHQYMFNYNTFYALASETGLTVTHSKKFLFGVNQLFVLSRQNIR